MKVVTSGLSRVCVRGTQGKDKQAYTLNKTKAYGEVANFHEPTIFRLMMMPHFTDSTYVLFLENAFQVISHLITPPGGPSRT